MMQSFIPEFDGDLELAGVPNDFAPRLKKRAEDGLLTPGRRSARTDYFVRSEDSNGITLAAGNFLTAYNVGLNEIRVSRSGPTTLHYHVNFWRWTWTAVGHGALLGLLFLASFAAFPEARTEIAAYPFGLVAFAAIAGFFCILWPWILTAIQKPLAEKTLQRILRETMA